MTAEKTSKPVVTQHQQGSGAFFRKAAEEGFFGQQQAPAFFSPVVQPKLNVSQPDDPQEREADQVAEHVMRMPEAAVPMPADDERKDTISAKLEAPVNISRQAEEGEVQAKSLPRIQRQATEDGEDRIMPKLSGERAAPAYLRLPGHSPPALMRRKGRDPPQPAASFETTLSSTRGAGTLMPAAARGFMERRFGADFSGVRIHTGSTAVALNRTINAQAFTHGADIYFNSGKFAPESSTGKSLLAHELTHVMQQNQSLTRKSVSNNILNAEKGKINRLYQPPNKNNSENADKNNRIFAASRAISRHKKPVKNHSISTKSNNRQLISFTFKKTSKIPKVAKQADKKTAGNKPELHQIKAVPKELLRDSSDMSVSESPIAVLTQFPKKGLIGLISDNAKPATSHTDSSFNNQPSPETPDIPTLIEAISVASSTGKASLRLNQKQAEQTVNKSSSQALQSIQFQLKADRHTVQNLFALQQASLSAQFVSATSQIARQLHMRSNEIIVNGLGTNARFLLMFYDHKSLMNKILNRKIQEAEQKRIDYRTEAQEKTEKKAEAAERYGRSRLQYYPTDTERGQMQFGASYEVAEQTAEEIRNDEPSVIDAVDQITASFPETIQDEGNKVLIGIENNLPPLTAEINSNVAGTLLNINQEAINSYAWLQTAHRTLEAGYADMEKAAISRLENNSSKASKAVTHVAHALTVQIRQSGLMVTGLVQQFTDDSISVLTSGGAIDAQSGKAFVNQIVGLISGVSEASADAIIDSTGELSEQIKTPGNLALQEARHILRLTRTNTAKAGVSINTQINGYVSSVSEAFIMEVSELEITHLEIERTLEAQLADSRHQFAISFDPIFHDTEETVQQAIGEGMQKNNEALGMLPDKMNAAADEAAYEYDHPVLSALEFLGGIIWGIAKVLAMVVVVIVAFELIVAGLIVAGVSAAVAAAVAAVIGVGILAYQVYSAYEARRSANQGFWTSLGGAVADVTGISAIYKSFTEPGLSPFERGDMLGTGAATAASFVFGERIARAVRARLPLAITNPVRGSGLRWIQQRFGKTPEVGVPALPKGFSVIEPVSRHAPENPAGNIGEATSAREFSKNPTTASDAPPSAQKIPDIDMPPSGHANPADLAEAKNFNAVKSEPEKPLVPETKTEAPEIRKDGSEGKKDIPDAKGSKEEFRDLGTEGGKKVLAEEPVQEGHKIKVTEDGKCLFCSDCIDLREKYARELNDSTPDVVKIKADLDAVDAMPSGTPEQAQAKANAEAKVQQALEHIRRERTADTKHHEKEFPKTESIAAEPNKTEIAATERHQPHFVKIGTKRTLGLSTRATDALKTLENIKSDPIGDINSKARHNHYKAARREAAGDIVMEKPNANGKPYSHIGDLQRAADGLHNVLEALKAEIKNPPSTISERGIDVLDAKFREVNILINRIQGFLNEIGHGKWPPYHEWKPGSIPGTWVP